MPAKHAIVVSISILILTLAACIYECTYSYYVINKSTSTIKLIVEGYGEDSKVSQQYVIAPNSDQLVFVNEGIDSEIGNEPANIFTVFKVLKNDSVPTRTDFKLRDKWIYVVTSSKKSSRAAKFTTEVNDLDF